MFIAERLKKAIEESGLPISFIAKKLSITREGLYKKINGDTEFKASEIVNISGILQLSTKERDAIFFAPKCEFNSQMRS